jgi:hypothetical protein
VATLNKCLNRIDLLNESVDELLTQDYTEYNDEDLKYILNEYEHINSELSKIQIVTKKTKNSGLIENNNAKPNVSKKSKPTSTKKISSTKSA